MEKSIEIHPISQIDILRGRSEIDLGGLVDQILEFKTQRLDPNPINSHYEDTKCPDSPIIDEIVAELKAAFKGVTGMDLVLMDMWSHIHEKNMSTNQHSHYPADVSGVFYIKVPEGSGQLVFHPAANPYHPGRIPFKPEEKLFFLFPSFLDHSVTRNQSDETRISLSFNFKIKKESPNE